VSKSTCARATRTMELVRLGADLLVAAALQPDKRREAMSDLLLSEFHVQALAYEELREGVLTKESEADVRKGFEVLRTKADELLRGRRPFHWPLEFPEPPLLHGGNSGAFAQICTLPFRGWRGYWRLL
jgi:hypothetical protein